MNRRRLASFEDQRFLLLHAYASERGNGGDRVLYGIIIPSILTPTPEESRSPVPVAAVAPFVQDERKPVWK